MEHEDVFRRCFELIREMRWGLFRDLDRTEYPGLWRLLVTGDRWHPDVGDLKRKVNTAALFCGLIDIHAYTDFCERNKLNYSMIEMLDSMIQQNIREIARKNGCIARRTAGDMVILVGVEAEQLIRTVLGIIDFFSVRRTIKSEELTEARRGFEVAIPDLHVSAGIAGGLGYSSVVITADGDLSGSIVNTAARLQNFAGFLSPSRSALVVTGQVHAALHGATENNFAFFNYGRVRFKGIDVPVLEVLFSETGFKKLGYQAEYTKVLKTVKKGLWRERLVPDILGLVDRVLETSDIDRSRFHVQTRWIREIMGLWESRDHYEELGDRLTSLVEVVASLEQFDRVATLYLEQTATLFSAIGREYRERLIERVLSRQESIYTSRERRVLRLAERISVLRMRLLDRGFSSLPESTRRKEWNATLDRHTENLEFEIYSGKR